MFNWLWKRLGYHVCEEFTQWVKRQKQCERPATMDEYIWSAQRTITFTKTWQERQCTICGLIQQRELNA